MCHNWRRWAGERTITDAQVIQFICSLEMTRNQTERIEKLVGLIELGTNKQQSQDSIYALKLRLRKLELGAKLCRRRS